MNHIVMYLEIFSKICRKFSELLRFDVLVTCFIVCRSKKQIKFYEQSIHLIESEIEKIVETDTDLKQRVEKIKKVKGLGLITVIIVLCETNGFLPF